MLLVLLILKYSVSVVFFSRLVLRELFDDLWSDFSSVTNIYIFTGFVCVVCSFVICFHWCLYFLYLDWSCIWCSLIFGMILLLWMVSFFWRILHYLFTTLWYYFSPIANLYLLKDFPFTNFSLISFQFFSSYMCVILLLLLIKIYLSISKYASITMITWLFVT